MTSRAGRVLAGLLLAALVIAGVVSGFASGSPDGLTAVSEDKGFSSLETEHAAADSPLAGYELSGVGNDRLSVGLAGVAGVAVTFVLGAAIFLAVRRGARPDQPREDVPDGLSRRSG